MHEPSRQPGRGASTRRVHPELRVAAYAVCIDNDQLLLARYVGRGGRWWTLPGGGIDHGEDPYHAVIREVAEETGYTIEVEDLIGIHSARREYPRGAFGIADHHTVRVLYTGRITGGELRHELNGTTDMAAWVPLDRIGELDGERAELVDIGLELARQRPPAGHR